MRVTNKEIYRPGGGERVIKVLGVVVVWWWCGGVVVVVVVRKGEIGKGSNIKGGGNKHVNACVCL